MYIKQQWTFREKNISRKLFLTISLDRWDLIYFNSNLHQIKNAINIIQLYKFVQGYKDLILHDLI